MDPSCRKRPDSEASSTPFPKKSKTSTSSSFPIAAPSLPGVRLMDSAAGSSGSKNPGRDRERDSDKGKEKEPEFEFTSSRRERGLGLGFRDDETGIDDDDDDDDSDGSFALLQQNFTSASTALQGLLRKLGAGLDDWLPPGAAAAAASSAHGGGRLKKILAGLRADGEDGRRIEALTQLCEMLLTGSEDSFGGFPVDSFLPVLVDLLNHESNADVMVLAARALTHLCEVLPSSCGAVVHYGAVPCFCARLLNIEYMDLAEQSLQALRKISQEHPTACLRAGALMAVLSFLDFFPTGVQRIALATAANMCKKLPSDAANLVMEAVPLLTNLLQSHDSKVLEHSCVCLIRIAEAFSSSPEKLDDLANHGLVAQAASLISISNSGGGQTSLSTSTYTGLIRLLSICASGSSLGAKTLLLLGISGILKDILSGSDLVGNISVSPALTRPPDQIFEIVNLADVLLPPLPDGSIFLPTCCNFQMKSPTRKYSLPISTGKLEDRSINATEDSAREKLYRDQPEFLQQFGMEVLPTLVQVYESTVNIQVRYKCLSVIGKLMYFSTTDMILLISSAANLSSFLAGVLVDKDPQVLIPAIQIAEILVEKLPEIFIRMFVREGVFHAVDLLISNDSSNMVSAQFSSTKKDNDLVCEASSHPKPYLKQSGCSNPVRSSLDEPKVPFSVNIASCLASVEILTTNSSTHWPVTACAKAFKDKCFPSGLGEAEVGVTDELLRLKSLCVILNTAVDDLKTKANGNLKAIGSYFTDLLSNTEEHLIEVISSLLEELRKEDAVSTFEFIGSGVVEALLNYISCGAFYSSRKSEANSLEFRKQALRRLRLFTAVALPSGFREGGEIPMTVLIRKLQNALSSLERFPVVLSPSRSFGGNARTVSGFSSLPQPFKLRLCRAQGDKSLRDYSSKIVLIDPLSSLAAVEEFLWPRVQRGESRQKGRALGGSSESGAPVVEAGFSSCSTSALASATRHHSSNSRSLMTIGGTSIKGSLEQGSGSSLKRRGKSFLLSAPKEARGPQSRNTAQRGAAVYKAVSSKPAHGDSTSEDEFDVSPLEIDDALVIEEDDLSDCEDDDHQDVLKNDVTVCMPDNVNEVKLGDSAGDTMVVSGPGESHAYFLSGSNKMATALRGVDSGNTSDSKGAMSYATAMDGLVHSNSRGLRGGRDRQRHRLAGCTNDPPKLVFSASGKQLNRNMTIYQAVQDKRVVDEEDERHNGEFLSYDGNRVLDDVYTIMYQRADSQIDGTSTVSLKLSPSELSKTGSAFSCDYRTQLDQISLVDGILLGDLPCDLGKSNPTYCILALLRALECVNQLAPQLRAQAMYDDFSKGKILSFDDLVVVSPKVPQEEFVNTKLTPKLSRQIQDTMALCSGSLPLWCYQLTKACPFLFPFEIRRQYFHSTAFGLSHALHWLQQRQGADAHSSANEREARISRLQRQKVRVSRNRILDSAMKVMEMYCSQKGVLEVEYFGEIGTGLGPTLEFYTLLSHDLQKVGLGMWRSSCSTKNPAMETDEPNRMFNSSSEGNELGSGYVAGAGDLVQAPLGLFPRPWPPSAEVSDGSQFSKVLEYFQLVGRVMAKALQDGRPLDLPLSTAFYKLVLGQELDLHDISLFDAELGKILHELRALVCRKRYLESTTGHRCEENSGLCFRGAPIEDLCLDFSLPGYPDYFLRPGEKNVDVNNLEEYIALIVDATVKSGIRRQMEAFISGFNQVFDISALQIFFPHELDYLLCGRRELWEAAALVDHIKFDHGYTAKSPVIVNLLEIMGEFTPEQQRAFCQFVTGAPRLPPGGLAMLNPKLTIVRKTSYTTTNSGTNVIGASESVDEDLPSVMTCANYLKLPPYSTKEIMYKKLHYAIKEGQGSFDLS
ncbi:E3 ubiquitin-protein ligase UPL3-like isoform X2 [Malania oleifera]|uniref:E3 ubiquitin-protein ligase UPL3-like isoform X2 n=1 Tax=Malania oleifera TaxID=397392 RepID=UPI0025AE19CF|nr:E3 ubiquitin-protein ligase UPL3-like isoform X2 [Malania oleifera]